MTSASSTQHFDPVSRAFHWLTAIVIVAAFILGPEHFGRLMRDGLDPATRWDIVWHESLGVSVFVLTLLRLVWVALRPAAPRFDMNPWMQRAARMLQDVLWLLMLLLPITALLALGSEGHPLTLLGGLRVDQMPFIANSPLAEAADWGEVHGFLGDAILWLAGAHAAAAIYHHVVLKDGVLKSMLLPGRDAH
nr:cytochrome b/b6 domain-containing protein [Ideonella oryzae]